MAELVNHKEKEIIREIIEGTVRVRGRNENVTFLKVSFCMVLTFRTILMIHMLKKDKKNKRRRMKKNV